MSAHLSAVPPVPEHNGRWAELPEDLERYNAQVYRLAADLVRCGGPTPDGGYLVLSLAEERTAHRLALLLESHASAAEAGEGRG